MGSPSVTTSTTGSASGCLSRKRPASISACCRLVPWMSLASRSGSSCGLIRRARLANAMISTASSGNCVVASACSAMAVVFAVRQVSFMTIENDWSTSSATAARVRRSVSRISKSSGRSSGAVGVDHAAAYGVRHGLHDVERLLVAEPPLARRAGELAGGPGVVHVVVAAAAALERGEHAAQRRLPDAADRLGGELDLAALAGEVALALELALDLLQPRAGRRRPGVRGRGRRPPRRRPRATRRGSPGRAPRTRESRSARSASASVASPRPSGSSPRSRCRPLHGRSGRIARRLSLSRPISAARSRSPSASAMSSASSSRCSGVIDSSIRCIAAAWRASWSSSSLERLAGSRGRTRRACP